jgi:hypothetical protein
MPAQPRGEPSGKNRPAGSEPADSIPPPEHAHSASSWEEVVSSFGTPAAGQIERPLTFKEVCYVLKKSRWTVSRWKKRGCPFVHGRILWSALILWLAEDERQRRYPPGKT